MISFDFFDTLITRDVFQPSDIFYFVGKQARKQKLIELTEEEFKKIRIEAEARARQNSIHEEVTLDEIYNNMLEFLNVSNDTLEILKGMEKSIEKKSFVLIEENAKKICDNSIVVTDTYHNKDFIEEILLDFNLKVKEIFVSSEYKKMKHFGSLYDEVLKSFSIKMHIGDNKHSDHDMALKKNIEATMYFKSRPTRYENIIYNSALPYDLRAVLSGVMKSSRLQMHYDDDHLSVIHNVSSNVIAPFLYAYVNWILKEAIKTNIDTLYFIARDGQILFEIAKIIKRHLKLRIELRYLYGSRKAWHLPAVSEVNEDVIDWIFDPTYFLSLDDICNRAEIDITEVVNILKLDFSHNQNLNQNERDLLKKEFSMNSKIHTLILESAKKRRSEVLEYLAQEGFNSERRVAVVDVGWRGRQQVSLSKLLKLGNIYPKSGIVGFYLSLTNPVKPVFDDVFISFFDREKFRGILEYPGIYENFVAADHGSCIGYTKSNNLIVPMLREKKNSLMLEWGLDIQHKAILNFADRLTASLLKYSVDFSNELEISKLVLKPFLHYPTFEETNSYGKIKLFEDQEEKKFFYMCETISTKDLINLLFFRNKLNHNLWVEGSISKSFRESISKIVLTLLEIRKTIRRLFL